MSVKLNVGSMSQYFECGKISQFTVVDFIKLNLPDFLLTKSMISK